jgi:subtilisin family serine protease
MPPPVVPRVLIERLLNDSALGLRLIQDLAILADVWAAFGADPNGQVNLLLSPDAHVSPPRAARAVADALATYHAGVARPVPNYVSPLQGFVTATVDFGELIDVLAPLLGVRFGVLSPAQAALVMRRLDDAQASGTQLDRVAAPTLWTRTSALVALITASREFASPVRDFADAAAKLEGIAGPAAKDLPPEPKEPADRRCMLRRATLNRAVQRLGSESIRTVKADAARRVFDTSAADLVWAVIDSGIDATHDAFFDETKPNKSRVLRAYDFSRLRRLTSFDILRAPDGEAYKALAREIAAWRKAAPAYPDEDMGLAPHPNDLIKQLAADADHERPPSWALIEPLLRLPYDTPPIQPHGTHVAGIMAGDWKRKTEDRPDLEDMVGVCPDLQLFDIRILGDSEEETEAAIIGALEFIRWLNGRNRWRVVHGANLSIGMKHDVRNWACGQTPICVACEDLVASGVVVVAAAGNDGWQSFLVGDDKRYDGYALASITDPGNAESVITVGATHRERPHLYGVSFFSSRGPTGDGRMKPDLLAPGEKIEGPLPFGLSGVLDGTSMAAPHVSGVCALLMARHNELQGRPAEVKQILMATAVDLGRERSAQGAGLVDALAALQRR